MAIPSSEDTDHVIPITAFLIITRLIAPSAIPLPLLGAVQGIQLGETRLSVRRVGLCEKLRQPFSVLVLGVCLVGLGL